MTTATRGKHGTTTAWYQDGCRCDPCKAHYKVIRRRARVKAKENPPQPFTVDGSVPGLIIDILETHHGAWWTVENLWHETQRIRGKMITRDFVGRTCHRLIRQGRIQSRKVFIGHQVPAPTNSRWVVGDHTYAQERLEVMCPRREYLYAEED